MVVQNTVSTEINTPSDDDLPFLSSDRIDERDQKSRFCLKKILNDCPLQMENATSWKHADSIVLIIATGQGIYWMRWDDPAWPGDREDCEMKQVFSRPCKWVGVFQYRDILLSISGDHSYVYTHNLIAMHKNYHSDKTIPPKSRNVAFSTKIAGSGNTLKCCIAGSPDGRRSYVFAVRADGILILRWYESVKKFMKMKMISSNMPKQLSVFIPIVKNDSIHPILVVGATLVPDTQEIIVDVFDTELGKMIRGFNSDRNGVAIKHLHQVAKNETFLVCDKYAHYVRDIDGMTNVKHDEKRKLEFTQEIGDIVYWDGSLFSIHSNGVEGRSMETGHRTAFLNDASKEHRLLCSEGVVVVQRLPRDGETNPSSRLFVLTNRSKHNSNNKQQNIGV